jgi:hypothetical protein
MDILLLVVVGTLNVVCFFVGAWVGQKVNRGETLKIPDPVEAIQAKKERKEARREADRYETIMQNIDRYDGTGNGQREVPRR